MLSVLDQAGSEHVFLRPFSHFTVCEKVFKHSNNAAFIHEANILS